MSLADPAADGRTIHAFHEKPAEAVGLPDASDRVLASMGNYVFDAKVRQFVDTQTGSIAKLHNRQVARRASGSYQPSNFCLAFYGRQAFGEFPPNQVARHGSPCLPPELQTIAQAAQGVQPCLYSACHKAFGVKESNETADVFLRYSR